MVCTNTKNDELNFVKQNLFREMRVRSVVVVSIE